MRFLPLTQALLMCRDQHPPREGTLAGVPMTSHQNKKPQQEQRGCTLTGGKGYGLGTNSAPPLLPPDAEGRAVLGTVHPVLDGVIPWSPSPGLGGRAPRRPGAPVS